MKESLFFYFILCMHCLEIVKEDVWSKVFLINGFQSIGSNEVAI